MKKFLICLICLLILPVAIYARERGFRISDLKDFAGYGATGVGGILTVLIVFFPKIISIIKAVKEAQEETVTFVNKCKSRFEGEMRSDFFSLLKKYDKVTEKVADLFARFQMHRTAKRIRDIITSDMLG